MADSEKASGASSSQMHLIDRIGKHTPLKISPGAKDSMASARAWIDLALFSCSDGELSKIGKPRQNKLPDEIARHVATISRTTELAAPIGLSQRAIREWLDAISKSVKVPPANKLLKYWSRALSYRDLNALARQDIQQITESIAPETLPQSLPRLVEGFEPPKSGAQDDPVALMIAFTASADKTKASVLLGIPLAWDSATRALVPPPKAAVPFMNSHR